MTFKNKWNLFCKHECSFFFDCMPLSLTFDLTFARALGSFIGDIDLWYPPKPGPCWTSSDLISHSDGKRKLRGICFGFKCPENHCVFLDPFLHNVWQPNVLAWLCFASMLSTCLSSLLLDFLLTTFQNCLRLLIPPCHLTSRFWTPVSNWKRNSLQQLSPW